MSWHPTQFKNPLESGYYLVSVKAVTEICKQRVYYDASQNDWFLNDIELNNNLLNEGKNVTAWSDNSEEPDTFTG